MIGLEPRLENFGFLLVVIFVVVNTGFSVAQLISAGLLFLASVVYLLGVKTMSMGITLYALFIVHNLLLGGFIVEKKMMPENLQWLIFTSYFYYGFQALVSNEFEHKV